MASVHDIDRRWIFLAMGILVVWLVAVDIPAPMPVNEYVESYFATVDKLPENSIVMLSADFDPASAAELLPMYTATIHHLFKRGVRVVNVSTWPAAPPYTSERFASIAPVYGAEYGVNWVELGFLPGDDVAMGNIGQSLKSAYPRETKNGTAYDDVPLLRDCGDSMGGIELLITMSAGYPGILEWIAQVGGRYEVELLSGTTAVQTPDLFAFYPSQLSGFLGAATGATQYLQLVDEIVDDEDITDTKEEQQSRMLVQTWAHFLMILLIIVGNLIYFFGPKGS